MTEEELLREEIKFYRLKLTELSEENKNLNKFKKKYIEQYEICKAQEVVLEKKDKIINLIISRISCNLTIFDKELQQYIKSEMEKGEYTNLDKLVKQYFEKQVEN